MNKPLAPRSSFRRLPAIAAIAALMTACAAAPPPSAGPAARLQAYDWNLTAAYDPRGQAAPDWRLDDRLPLRVHFEGGRISVRNLCNLLGATYTLQDTRLQILEISHPLSTKRWCPNQSLMSLERRVEEQLPTAQRIDLRDGGPAPQLTLHFADGSRWELTGAPTPQTRYGGSVAAQRLFLEVAPYRVPCGPGAEQETRCLRVREIRYADNGVQQSAGEWRVFHDPIEGYTHEPGLRNILRVNRFKRPGAADAYVLDLVVESMRVSEP